MVPSTAAITLISREMAGSKNALMTTFPSRDFGRSAAADTCVGAVFIDFAGVADFLGVEAFCVAAIWDFPLVGAVLAKVVMANILHVYMHSTGAQLEAVHVRAGNSRCRVHQQPKLWRPAPAP